jgi:MFS transporter, PPP family, 3-phenylpropionic acid transporter
MPIPSSLALSLFYLTSFAVLGAYLPYLNLYLERIGLSGLQIGTISALVPLCSAIAPTAGGMFADRIGRRRELVIASTVLALVVFCFMPGVSRFTTLAVILSVYAVLRAPALPLVEASALEISESGGPSYGRMRVWGSLSFIAVSLATGPLVGRWGEGVALPILIGLLALNALSALLLPPDPGRHTRAPGGVRLSRLVIRPQVAFFLAACVLSQAAHGPYYVFYSIHLQDSGYGPGTIGLLWALAVGCEVIAMLRMPAVLARLGTLKTLGFCLLLAAARWWICAATTSPWAMVLAQGLHAASYAAFHVAAVTHAHRLFGPDRRASGQAIYSSLTYGVGNVIGMFLSGVFYDRVAIRGLFAAACGVALLGALLVLAASRRELRDRRGL